MMHMKRTNLVLDEKLLEEATRLAGERTYSRTVERALERRRMNLQNRRLVWELQTINEISGSISRSLELEEVLTVALQRLVAAFDATGGSIRLLDELTGQYELRAVVGPESMSSVWTVFEATVPCPSEKMIATRKPIVIEDLAALLPADVGLHVCSCVSLPMLVRVEADSGPFPPGL